ncbi:hypothetical protein NMY22_g19778 [Coprinellus aureogranulatus]|nr:hypothetical protein NMY22_g19778 [Coprinellus aureogranulatus]
MTKYIVVSGGVVSGIGKGVIASSTGLLLKTTGLKVTAIKIDPYMNIDAGTMRPTEHGEVYVLNDGGEVDLDLGNYERYLNVTLSRDNNITTGKIYREVIEKEPLRSVASPLRSVASYARTRPSLTTLWALQALGVHRDLSLVYVRLYGRPCCD